MYRSTHSQVEIRLMMNLTRPLPSSPTCQIATHPPLPTTHIASPQFCF